MPCADHRILRCATYLLNGTIAGASMWQGLAVDMEYLYIRQHVVTPQLHRIQLSTCRPPGSRTQRAMCCINKVCSHVAREVGYCVCRICSAIDSNSPLMKHKKYIETAIIKHAARLQLRAGTEPVASLCIHTYIYIYIYIYMYRPSNPCPGEHCRNAET